MQVYLIKGSGGGGGTPAEHGTSSVSSGSIAAEAGAGAGAGDKPANEKAKTGEIIDRLRDRGPGHGARS